MSNKLLGALPRALIVDDESDLRKLMKSALSAEGFLCDTATSGDDAWRRVRAAAVPYQLVVSDLAMPDSHGHALAINLLTLPERPVIAILSGILEPRLVKDLIARGIDEFAFKPINYPAFAAKLRGLVNRRRSAVDAAALLLAPTNGLPRVSQPELDEALRKLTHVAPISQCALELFKLTSQADADVDQVSAAVQCDPALIVELLRLANSSRFNSSGNRISDVGQAVVCLGLKRVGELALSTAALGTFRQDQLPFFPLGRVWRKCLAAGICLEMLLERLPRKSTEGLFSSAVLQPIGRLILASLFPEVYAQMLEHCRERTCSLWELEREVFPCSVGEVIAQALSTWGIPDAITQTLRYGTEPFDQIESAPEATRRSIELVKSACFLGELAVGDLASWEQLDLPGPAVWQRLRLESIDGLLATCREECSQLASFGGDSTAASMVAEVPSDRLQSVAYLRLDDGGKGLDCIPSLLAALGIRVVAPPEKLSDLEGTLFVNAQNASATHIAARLRRAVPEQVVILTHRDNRERVEAYGRPLGLPCSVAALDAAFAAAHPVG